MESAGKRQCPKGKTQMFIPGGEPSPPPPATGGYVYLPVSYTVHLADSCACPDEDENPLGPADVRRILKFAPGVEEKLMALGLACRVEDYEAMYAIPANEIPAQDVRAIGGSVHLVPKNHPGQLYSNSRGTPRSQPNLKVKPLENRVTSLGVTTKRLETDFNNLKKLMQVTVKKLHKLHLQVLILRTCNNLASKLGLVKEADQRWFEFLQRLREDQWRQVQLGRDAQDILIETSIWVEVNLATTKEDMAKAIWSLKKLGKDDIDHGLNNVNNNVSAGKGRRGWDKAFRLESAEEVHGWDELFKLASGSDKSFAEFLDDHDPSSSMAPLVVPDRNNRS